MNEKTMIASGLFFLSWASAHADLTQLETRYLVQFANYTGNLPSHSFDMGFRQAILHSKDEDVQKAFILQKLPHELDSILDTLKSGKQRIGKDQYENLSEENRKTLLAELEECMTLVQKLDGGKHKEFYSEYRSKLDEAISSKKH